MMNLVMVGLGKMGLAMTRRLLEKGHGVVAYDLNTESVAKAAEFGAVGAVSLEDAVDKLDGSPRVVWVMVPSGDPVTVTLQSLAGILDDGDILIDGGNSNYRQSSERASMLRYRGIEMLDVGVSGGIWGYEKGFNLMVGGDEETFGQVEPVFKSLAPEGGYGYIGPSGAGHFVKMVHNGIEYGMMQAIGEGLELVAAKEEYGIDIGKLCRLWENGSVVRSWLLELSANVLDDDPYLDWVDPYVADSGEGRWTVEESIELRVPIPVITLALQMRFRSRQDNSYTARLLAALRNAFGGHAIPRSKG